MEPPGQAEQTIGFGNQYRNIINCNLGRGIIRTHIEKTTGTSASPDREWQVFFEILSTRRMPSGLQ